MASVIHPSGCKTLGDREVLWQTRAPKEVAVPNCALDSFLESRQALTLRATRVHHRALGARNARRVVFPAVDLRLAA